MDVEPRVPEGGPYRRSLPVLERGTTRWRALPDDERHCVLASVALCTWALNLLGKTRGQPAMSPAEIDAAVRPPDEPLRGAFAFRLLYEIFFVGPSLVVAGSFALRGWRRSQELPASPPHWWLALLAVPAWWMVIVLILLATPVIAFGTAIGS